jgi:Flp pilus assembly protein TadG
MIGALRTSRSPVGCRPALQRGQVLIVVALVLVALIGSIGLAVDAGLGYLVKARLNAAVDSAGIAAARAVSQGNDRASQETYAKAAARNFFAANYPAGYLGSTAQLQEPSVQFDRGKVTIDIAANASLPVRLMGMLGADYLSVQAASQTIRKDLDMAFVMDTSGSMSGVGSRVKSSAITFLNRFGTTTDRVGLVRFAYGAEVPDPIRTTSRGFDRTTMAAHINGFNFAGSTNSSEGLWHGRDQLNSIAPLNRSSLRVIVFFSDGSPNSFSSYFPFDASHPCATPGTISTGDETSAAWPTGLRRQDRISTNLAGNCWGNTNIATPAYIKKLPDWYNAHNPTAAEDPSRQEFRIVTGAGNPDGMARIVTSDLSTREAAWRNVNRASRNLLEAVGAKAREEGIYIFSLGLGSMLLEKTGPDKEKGEDLLKCIANTTDAPARCFNPNQPVGLYCYAATENDLGPCFARLASEILRIAR